MSKYAYTETNFRGSTLKLIEQAIDIIAKYRRQGYRLTLRQLYYQFVAAGLIPNNDLQYKRLGSAINDGRMAGLIDWDDIVDLTRGVMALPHWETPGDIISSAAQSYTLDKRVGQEYYLEVWIEKDALKNVIARVCNTWDVPYLSCRGYTSQTAMRDSGLRLLEASERGQTPVVIHLGDHDPSGQDMTRDVTERLLIFAEQEIEVDRIALNMDQIRRYNPPPNPAKLTDSRVKEYKAKYGNSSWELDALEPQVIAGLVTRAIEERTDVDAFNAIKAREERERAVLLNAASRWSEVADFLGYTADDDE